MQRACANEGNEGNEGNTGDVSWSPLTFVFPSPQPPAPLPPLPLPNAHRPPPFAIPAAMAA
jgi:hypothetical protein